MREQAKKAASNGIDCFLMAKTYLEGKDYRGRFSDLKDLQEGDLLMFHDKDGVFFVISIGNGRGYGVSMGGKPIIMRLAHLHDSKFLAGVHLA